MATRSLPSISRYAEVHFVPDVFGDLVFNDVASDVIRQSTLTGMQGDGSYIVNDQHTLRAGFAVSGEQTNVTNTSTVLPDPGGGGVPPGSTPFNVTDQTSLLGWNIGTYVQDEWRADEPTHAEHGPAVRPTVSIRRRQSAQPAIRHRL